MRKSALLVALFLAASCRKPQDNDGDSFASDVDCDDSNVDVNPSAIEVCDLVDQDCDGLVDEDAEGAPLWYPDADADGYGESTSSTASCAAPPGTSNNSGDCDDADPARHPGASETDCTDPIDWNCDRSTGFADEDQDGFAACEDCDDSDADVNPDTVWYADLDGDGHGSSRFTTTSCLQPEGFVATTDDCDDFDARSFPDADETCDQRDNDCDGTIDNEPVDAETFYGDGDGDGYGETADASTACEQPANSAIRAGDCDDADPAVHPLAPEIDCTDATDYNCDGATGFSDGDNDGYAACKDCDDTRNDVHPSAIEVCDDADQDCDGSVDEDATDATLFYADVDADGHGGTRFTATACKAPQGYTTTNDDCDDLDPTAFPTAAETCDGADDNCDGTKDNNAVDAKDQWPDVDDDGHGDPDGVAVKACAPPAGYSAADDDCDDSDAATYAGAPEPDCTDPIDYNCDGLTGFVDSDLDTFAACVDCDDTDPAAHKGAVEVCNGKDDDCDGTVDKGATNATVWYRDLDNDGHGDTNASVSACAAPAGYVASKDDCDDLDRTAYPGAAEVCDGVDDDCDGTKDDGVTLTFYADTDADGYGALAAPVQACAQPSGYVGNSTDCDDKKGVVHPGQFEVCDGFDDNCDGKSDDATAIDAAQWGIDSDKDGHGSALSLSKACVAPTGYATPDDCNDADSTVFPSATEYCDNIDHDCDTLKNETTSADAKTWYKDVDGDNYGIASTIVACAVPVGYGANPGDCDDTKVSVYLGAPETCDGLDNDCNLTKDDGTAIGAGAACAVASCNALKTARPTATSGPYWMTTAPASQTYCEQSLNGGGWTLVAKLTNQDALHWVTAKTDWTSATAFGTTVNLTTGADAKSAAWGTVAASEMMFSDNLSATSYVATSGNCLGGATPAAFFTTALATFPYAGEANYKTCNVTRNYWPGWAAEPDYAGNGINSPNLSLATNYLVVARTDASQDTSGVISFYSTAYPEADVGLGAMEDGPAFSTSMYQRDIGGPTSCSYADAECAAEYPQTVFFWVR